MVIETDSDCPLFKKKLPPINGSKIPLEKQPSPLKEIWDWCRNSPVYVRVRNLNEGGGPNITAAEIGLRFTF